MHNIKSTRTLAKAGKLNLEVRWLLEEIEHDFRNITSFIKDNVWAIKEIFYSFLEKLKTYVV